VQIGDLKKKVPWLKFERAREKWEESRTMLKRVKEQIKERQTALVAAQAPVRERQTVRDEADAARKKLKSASMKLEDKKISLDEQIMTLVRACLSCGGGSACRRLPQALASRPPSCSPGNQGAAR
jgi:chromosome segregation ATPase